LKPNCPRMIIGRSSFVEDHPMNIHVQFVFNHICNFWEEGIWIFSHRFFSDMKFKMAATAGLSLTLDPMGKMFRKRLETTFIYQKWPKTANKFVNWYCKLHQGINNIYIYKIWLSKLCCVFMFHCIMYYLLCNLFVHAW
jgi:hypothetical protein